MGTPTLNAAVSLYRTRGYYASTAGWTDALRGRVAPALFCGTGSFTGCVKDPTFTDCTDNCGQRCSKLNPDGSGVLTHECCPPEKCGAPPPSDDGCCRKVCCRATCE